ncbi:MAG: hypothetical protein ACNS64_00940 [Candidatus Halalkalibacterium sp. M3_1C_030]
MDIFKLFFEHDLRLDKLAKRNANKTEEEIEADLADFMKPTPTYSKFYLTGTVLKEKIFGLNRLKHWEAVLNSLNNVFNENYIKIENKSVHSFEEALDKSQIGDAIIISPTEEINVNVKALHVDEESNVGHFKEELSEVLQEGFFVLYKEQAHDGFDLHLFSKDNIYKKLFHAFKPLVSPDFRFFSINNRRMRSERHFYFETWTLNKPPHGAEEVLPETVL